MATKLYALVKLAFVIGYSREPKERKEIASARLVENDRGPAVGFSKASRKRMTSWKPGTWPR